MPHDELSLDLVNGIHGHAHHDQERSAAEVEIHAQAVQQKLREVGVDEIADERQMLQVNSGDHYVRNEAENAQVNTAHHGDLGEDVVHVVGGIASGPDAGDKSAVLAHVVG